MQWSIYYFVFKIMHKYIKEEPPGLTNRYHIQYDFNLLKYLIATSKVTLLFFLNAFTITRHRVICLVVNEWARYYYCLFFCSVLGNRLISMFYKYIYKAQIFGWIFFIVLMWLKIVLNKILTFCVLINHSGG